MNVFEINLLPDDADPSNADEGFATAVEAVDRALGLTSVLSTERPGLAPRAIKSPENGFDLEALLVTFLPRSIFE